MPDSNTPRDSDAPEPAPAAGDEAPPLSDSRAEAMLHPSDDEGVQPPTIISEINPDQPMGTAPMSGPGGWTPPSVEEAARLFPSYEVISLLGRGGMGAVYKARQIELDRLVAIKLLPLEVSADVSFADRFRREARAMAKLNHPNIIAVHDFGTTAAGHLFFVMEFVDGANLHQIIHGPGLEPSQALSIVIQVCEALAFAHEQGVVHRDIKPANVMVDQRGRAKVADFGLARLTDPSAEQMGHTMTGTVMGTPDYMAPEQMRGMNVDHRADIYSLGVMLYEMLCKDVPRGFFDPPSVRAGTDSRLDDVVKKAMQQQPERRYQQTGEMRTDVEEVRAAMVQPSPSLVAAVTPGTGGQRAVAAAGRGTDDAVPSRPPRKSKLPLWLAIAAAVLVLAALAFVITRPAKPLAKNIVQSSPATPVPDIAPIATPANTAIWQPLITAATSPAHLPGKREWSDNRLHLLLNAVNTESTHADGALRARIQFQEGSRAVGLVARSKTTGESYKLNVLDRASVSLNVIGAKGQRLETLGRHNFPKPLAAGDLVTLELRAQGDRLTGLVNGTAVIEARDTRYPGAGTWGIVADDGWFETAEFQPFPAMKPAAADANEKWTDALAEWWAKSPDATKGLLVKEADGSRVVDNTRGIWLTRGMFLGNGRDMAIRATVRGIKKSSWRIALRVNSQDKNYYSAVVKHPADGPSRLDSIAGDKTTTLQEFTLPSSFDTAARHTLELRAQGDLLTVLLDGQQVAQARDSSNTQAGDFFCATMPGSVIEKLEYRDLGTAAVGQAPRLPGTTPPPAVGALALQNTTPASASKDAPFVNSLGMKFVPVPITGGPTDGQRVLFSVWETRVQDYEVFAKETQRKWVKPQQQGASHPVCMMNCDDAEAFCAWLTKKDAAAGRLPAGLAYRLPTDAEWSAAVGLPPERGAMPAERKGSNPSHFPWGGSWPPTAKEGNYRDVEMPAPDGFAATSPVGTFPPNSLGLFDLGGNVWEWTSDWYDGTQTERALRGASYNTGLHPFLRSSHRDHYKPNVDYPNVGFRCVLAPVASRSAASSTASHSPSLPVSQSSVATATKDAPFVNTLGMKFVPVPITGGPTDGKRVLFSVWDTRVQDYEVFVKETGRNWPATPDFKKGPTYPAVFVSAEDAQAYCAWLTERERKAGKLGPSEVYRLPSDHEWSCAAGIGDREDAAKLPGEKHQKLASVYAWGTQWPPPAMAGNFAGEELRPAQAAGNHTDIKDLVANYNDGHLTASPVGTFSANPLGLYDMSGNVWQWCADSKDASKTNWVTRGGSWFDGSRNNLLSSYRRVTALNYRAGFHGFRVVLAPVATP